ncbi:MAG: hypothetical protein COB22_05975 [Cycloclasticus sp.]|nr:MAG: hypothetical protein COB22_05975 [Cycloclasticus sp.]
MKKVDEMWPIGDELTLETHTYDDEEGGTESLVELNGLFWVDGKRLRAFKQKLEALIEDFRV